MSASFSLQGSSDRLTGAAASSGAFLRTGILRLPHGDVHTPVFMPIATRGAVRIAPLSTLRDLDIELLLSNTYHLVLRPGVERIRHFGGLHRFIGWDRPILTDSGGFQVFSLRDHRTVTESGVTFRSPIDGTKVTLTPASVIEAQRVFGSDISMVLDDVRALPSSPEDIEEAVNRTTHWAEESLAAFRAENSSGADPRPLLFGIVQGGTDLRLRERSARDLVALGFDGYAIGGLSVGESSEEMLRVLDATMPLLPAARPRYLMGVGEPEDIVEAVRRGVDMFDCVLPTRNARHALVYADLDHAYLREVLRAPLGTVALREKLYQRLNMRNEAFSDDTTLLNPACPLLDGVTRGYLRHLFHVDPANAAVLATVQNLWFYQKLMKAIRELLSS